MGINNEVWYLEEPFSYVMENYGSSAEKTQALLITPIMLSDFEASFSFCACCKRVESAVPRSKTEHVKTLIPKCTEDRAAMVRFFNAFGPSLVLSQVPRAMV